MKSLQKIVIQVLARIGFNLENSFIIMMKGKIILPLVTIMTLMLALISSSYCVAWADSDKDLL